MTARIFKPLLESLLAGSGVRIGGDRPWDIRVNRDRFYRRALRGSLGIGEAYIDGDWDCDQLDEMFRRVLGADIQHRPLLRAAGWLKGLQSRLTNLQTRQRSRAVAEEQAGAVDNAVHGVGVDDHVGEHLEVLLLVAERIEAALDQQARGVGDQAFGYLGGADLAQQRTLDRGRPGARVGNLALHLLHVVDVR